MDIKELRDKLLHFVKYKFKNLNDIDNLAEDIVQDAFLIVKKEEQYNFKYLAAVCAHIAYREYRKQKQQKIKCLELERIDFLISEIDVPEQIYKNEFLSKLLGFIDALKETEKTILTLHIYENLSFEDISDRIDINRNTAKSIYRRSITKIKQRFYEITKEDILPKAG